MVISRGGRFLVRSGHEPQRVGQGLLIEGLVTCWSWRVRSRRFGRSRKSTACAGLHFLTADVTVSSHCGHPTPGCIPREYTLDPTPYALHPGPCTLNLCAGAGGSHSYNLYGWVVITCSSSTCAWARNLLSLPLSL